MTEEEFKEIEGRDRLSRAPGKIQYPGLVYADRRKLVDEVRRLKNLLDRRT